MKKSILLVLCGATLLTGCVYDDGYAVRRVSVSTGTPYYYGNFDAYTPYYSYGERQYYRTGNRYVYYAGRRPYYVTSVPTRSVYITPPGYSRSSVRVVRHHRHHHNHDDD